MDDHERDGTRINTTPEDVIDLESEETDVHYGTHLNMVLPTLTDEQVHGGNYFTSLLNEDGPLSPIGTGPGVDQTLNLNLFTSQSSNELAPLLGASFGNANSIIDLNSGVNSGPSAPNGPHGHADSSASGRLVSSSSVGVAGHLLEGNDGGEGTSNGRLLPCKRRAPEGVTRQLLVGESSRSAPQDGSSEQQADATQENTTGSPNASTSIGNQQDDSDSEDWVDAVNLADDADPFKLEIYDTTTSSTQGLGAGSGASFDLNVTAAQEDNFERNIRFRSSANQNDDLMLANQENWTAANSQVQSDDVAPPAMLFPFDPVPSQLSAVRSNPPPTQSLVRAVNSPQTLQHVQFQLPNGVTVLSLEAPPASTFPRGGTIEINLTGAIQQPSAPAESSRVNIEEEFEQSPTWNNPGDGSGELYAERLQVIVSQMEARRQAAAARDPFRSYSVLVPTQRPADPRRNLPGAPSLPLTNTQMRTRMMSNIRNALAFMRRGGTMRAEDLMVTGQPELNGVPEEQPIDDDYEDDHEDMRLDVDNMSYEELLELEDQMGYVETGVQENVITGHLARAEYQSTEATMNDETCCICQDEYADGEQLGRLNCRHYYHYNCIKRWLMEKNVCPICKVKALDV